MHEGSPGGKIIDQKESCYVAESFDVHLFATLGRLQLDASVRSRIDYKPQTKLVLLLYRILAPVHVLSRIVPEYFDHPGKLRFQKDGFGNVS